MTPLPPLVLQQPSGAIARADHGAQGWGLTPLAPRGSWPAINPAGDRFGLSVLEPFAGRVASHIDLYDASGGFLRMLHQLPAQALPVIAPRVPHYLHWSPTGEMLCYVARSTNGLGMFLCDPTGLLLADELLGGAPLFPAWSPDGRRLAVHAGSELHIAEVQAGQPGQGSITTAALGAVGFRTPCFSADSRSVYYAAAAPPGVALLAIDATGEPPREIARFDGGIAIGRQPQGAMLSIAVTRAPGTGVFDRLYLVDAATGDRRLVARGPFTACFWAPAGDMVSLVVPAQTGDGRQTVQVLSADGEFVAATEGFYAAPDWRSLLGFFDQYGLSHSPWARDGSAFVATGRLAGDGVHAAMGDADQRALIWR
ncbi:MAG: hypothetical protein WEC33_04230, partial [Dehalococcoidia bacterium]